MTLLEYFRCKCYNIKYYTAMYYYRILHGLNPKKHTWDFREAPESGCCGGNEIRCYKCWTCISVDEFRDIMCNPCKDINLNNKMSTMSYKDDKFIDFDFNEGPGKEGTATVSLNNKIPFEIVWYEWDLDTNWMMDYISKLLNLKLKLTNVQGGNGHYSGNLTVIARVIPCSYCDGKGEVEIEVVK